MRQIWYFLCSPQGAQLVRKVEKRKKKKKKVCFTQEKVQKEKVKIAGEKCKILQNFVINWKLCRCTGRRSYYLDENLDGSGENLKKNMRYDVYRKTWVKLFFFYLRKKANLTIFLQPHIFMLPSSLLRHQILISIFAQYLSGMVLR